MQPLEAAWQQITREFVDAKAAAAEAASRRVTDNLNQIARRLKLRKTQTDWFDAVLDGAAEFAAEVAVLVVEGEYLVVKGTRGISLSSGHRFSFDDAAAFRSARESREPVITLAAAKEVSEAVAAALPKSRALILPVANGERVPAYLFAAVREGADTSALELIANIASAMLEAVKAEPQPVQIAPPSARSGSRPQMPVKLQADSESRPESFQLPPWAELPEAERMLHVRAQRLARTKVAELQLYRPEACAAGLAQRDVYLFLKQEIDSARETFSKQFMRTPGMVDYLHLELLRQLANNDEEVLGADYPGQMV